MIIYLLAAVFGVVAGIAHVRKERRRRDEALRVFNLMRRSGGSTDA
jgi:pentatricopeptide repeat protein